MTGPLNNKHDLCFGFVNEENEIVALALNEISSKDDEKVDPLEGLEDQQSKVVMEFFVAQNEKVDFFSTFSVKKVFDVKIICVHLR